MLGSVLWRVQVFLARLSRGECRILPESSHLPLLLQLGQRKVWQLSLVLCLVTLLLAQSQINQALFTEAEPLGEELLRIVHRFSLLQGCSTFTWLVLVLALLGSRYHLAYELSLFIDV